MMSEEREIDVLGDISTSLAQISTSMARIATALEQELTDANRCVHGGTGLCMSCVIQGDLLRPQVPRR